MRCFANEIINKPLLCCSKKLGKTRTHCTFTIWWKLGENGKLWSCCCWGWRSFSIWFSQLFFTRNMVQSFVGRKLWAMGGSERKESGMQLGHYFAFLQFLNWFVHLAHPSFEFVHKSSLSNQIESKWIHEQHRGKCFTGFFHPETIALRFELIWLQLVFNLRNFKTFLLALESSSSSRRVSWNCWQ